MPSQKARDEVFTHLMDNIPTMQTDIALLKKDVEYITKSSDDHGKKQDALGQKQDLIIERLDKLSVVTPEQFEQWKREHKEEQEAILDKWDKRFIAVENYLSDNKPGIKLANMLITKWASVLVLLLILAALGTVALQLFK